MTKSGYPSVALVGPGAIGTTVAAALHEAGRTPVICGRSAHAELKLRFEGGEIVVPGPILTDPQAVKETVDLVFVAVKSTQTASAAPWVAALCDANTVICVLQNGVEQKAAFAPYAAGAAIVPSVVWFPAQRESGASVWLRAKPRLTLPDTPASNVVVSALRGALRARGGGGFHLARMAQAVAERRGRAHGADRSSRRHVLAKRHHRAVARLPEGMSRGRARGGREARR